MLLFADTAAAQNPFVVTLAQKTAGLPAMSAARRAELRAQAETIIATQVNPVWKNTIAALQSMIPFSTAS